MEAALKESGREILWLWKAVGEACVWLSALLKARRISSGSATTRMPSDGKASNVSSPANGASAAASNRKTGVLPVRISGTADAVLHDKQSGRWCCIEFKLSNHDDAGDFCQTALYHMLLETDQQSGDIALVRFSPERKERVLTAEQLKTGSARLLALADRLAGVTNPPLTLTEVRHRAIQYTATKQQETEIIRSLRSFGADVSSAGNPIVGPTFTRFQLKPAPGVRSKKF